MLQIILLAVFAVCAVLCFWFRLRVAMHEGAAQRGDSPEEEIRSAIARQERFAKLAGIAAGMSLALCILVGVIQKVV